MSMSRWCGAATGRSRSRGSPCPGQRPTPCSGSSACGRGSPSRTAPLHRGGRCLLPPPRCLGEGPRSYRSYTRGIVRLELKDPLTLLVVTGQAAPLLPRNLSTFGMVSARAAADAAEADFDGGRAAIGTGPYRLLGWSRGAAVTLARNERHWGEWPAWDKVTFRFIPNDTARVAALLAGDLDLIDAVPASLNQTILGRQGFRSPPPPPAC
ncbi:ABC transporter substrate-binding protein [Pseudoroseomonas wenyumeiae]